MKKAEMGETVYIKSEKMQGEVEFVYYDGSVSVKAENGEEIVVKNNDYEIIG